VPEENVCVVPQCIDIPDMEVDLELNSVDKLEPVSDNNDVIFQNGFFSNYDDNTGSIPPNLEEVDDSSTDNSFFSAGNAYPFPNHECFELKFKEPRYNYHGPKIAVPRLHGGYNWGSQKQTTLASAA
jgi:hypothetical protein